MKVVISGYVGKKITGIGRNLKGLLSHSTNNEYVLFANRDMVEDFAELPDNIEIRPYGVSKNSSLGNLLWTTFIFPFKARKEKADVALIPNFTLLLFRFLPTAVIMHDLIEFNIPNKFSKLKMFYRTKIADPITAKKASRIMTISQCSFDDISKHLFVPKEKIDLVYSGVDIGRFRNLSEEQYSPVLKRLSISRPFLLYAGTIDHPGKNAYSLIKAFEEMCSEGYNGSLVLAGMRGSGYEIIEETVKESTYSARICMTGYVSDEDLVALYSACDLFCFLSLYEGFGIPPLEALACGAKVLVSDRSSLPEVVGNCGRIVSPCDITAIKDAIRDELQNERDDIQVKFHLNKFSWKDLSPKFESFLVKASQAR